MLCPKLEYYNVCKEISLVPIKSPRLIIKGSGNVSDHLRYNPDLMETLAYDPNQSSVIEDHKHGQN